MPVTEDPPPGDPAVPGRPPPRVLHERGRLPWSLKLAVVVIHPLASLLFRQRYRHGERLPRTGPVLLVANHVSVLDPLACARMVYDHGRIPHFLAKEAVFRGLAGVILRDAGQIPVARGSSEARGALDAAAADLEAGNVVVIYPEGSVTRDGDWWPMQARTGVARLALTTDAVVLPVAQWGPQRVHDYHTKRLHPRLRTPTDHSIGEPVDLTALRAEVRAGRPLTPDLLREVTDTIMGRVRDLLADVRGEPAPPGFAARPRPSLPGGPPGSAA